MGNSRIMVTGAKDTFLVKVLVKKVLDADIDCIFVPWDVNSLNSNWEGTELITVYMDEGERPSETALRFMIDKMTDEEKPMIVIGEKNDIKYMEDQVPRDLLCASFPRPLDNATFIKTVSEHMQKVEAGALRKTILIVDDDANYLSLVREWLKETYKVAMANSGLQAIKWLGKNKADLILLDHEMPVTSGPKVLEMLRSDPDTSDIPVIFLTGKSDKESVMAVVALRPEGYFLKNIEKQELLEKIRDFFILHK